MDSGGGIGGEKCVFFLAFLYWYGKVMTKDRNLHISSDRNLALSKGHACRSPKPDNIVIDAIVSGCAHIGSPLQIRIRPATLYAVTHQ